MSDANELLREAQYAFQNIGHGSTDSKKYAAEARSLARRIISKYPDSFEVGAARLILEQLGERVPAPKARDQRFHGATIEQPPPRPQAQDIRPTAAPNYREPPRVGSKGLGKQYLLPGWALRLAQAVPVVLGAYLILGGIRSLSYSGMVSSSLVSVGAGAWLVYLPKTRVFAGLVNYAKTKVFAEEDWHAKADDLPTRQDLEELISAIWRGNMNKRIALIVALFFLIGFFVMIAAVLYVIGIRKAFDAIEGWLLDRKETVPPADPETKSNAGEAGVQSPAEPAGE